jgi:ATP-dependent Clp protease, protease subunit
MSAKSITEQAKEMMNPKSLKIGESGSIYASGNAIKSISKKNDWLSVVFSLDPAEPTEMIISGRIGKDWWDDSGTSAKDFRDELKKIPAGRGVKVRINSEGGSIQDGLEIYNALKDRRDDVTCYVDGYAVSIASVIALAGHKTVSPKSSIWMIHEPWCMTQGNSEDHQHAAEMLEKHGDMLASIYAEETGKSKKSMRQTMAEESWFTGEEAVAFGLADEMVDDSVALAALDPKAFKNIPTAILERISAAAPKADTHNQMSPTSPVTDSAAPSISDSTNGAGSTGNAASDNTETMHKEHMETTAQAAAVTPPPANNELAELRAQLQAEKTSRVTAEVMRRAENKIANDKLAFWISNAMANEKATYEQIDALPVATPGGEPIGRMAEVVNEGELDRISKLPTSVERYAALKKDWDNIIVDCLSRDQRGMKPRFLNRYVGRAVDGYSLPQNANTFSGTITTAFLLDGAVTILQNRWAPLMCFTREFSQDPYKPKATGIQKYVSATTAAQTDVTNFEAGEGDTIDPISVTMHQYTKNFEVTNAQLMGGLRMENLLTINAAGIADKIIAIATGPITVTNFGTLAGTTGAAAPLVAAASAFGFSDLATLWGGLKKSPIKNVLLDGEYLARVINSPTFYQVAGVQPGGGWSAFGWDYIALNTNWTGAGSGITGFACNPQAITVVAGLPLTPPQGIPGNTLQVATATVPDVGISIASYSWFSLASRTAWQSFDIMLGAAATDTTAGTLIKSS